MYDSILASVLWLMSWPVMIFIGYQLVKIALRIFEKRAAQE
jgi:uncharacterized membrane protein